MDTLFRPKSLIAMDKEIERLTNQLACMSPVDDDYLTVVTNLKTLCEARERKNDRSISAETLLTIAANVAGLLIVLNYEKANIITTKAFGLIWRGK